MTEADIIIQSCDLVNFRVHKSTLSQSSGFLYDIFSLPQPTADEIVDGLAVVRVAEFGRSAEQPSQDVVPNSFRVTCLLRQIFGCFTEVRHGRPPVPHSCGHSTQKTSDALSSGGLSCIRYRT